MEVLDIFISFFLYLIECDVANSPKFCLFLHDMTLVEQSSYLVVASQLFMSLNSFMRLRNKATLLPVIQQSVRKGTVIYSDRWRAYADLAIHGYVHSVLVHK